MKKPQEMTLDDWRDALAEYAGTKGYRNGAALRIENTPFTSARYAGGMIWSGCWYTYFEPTIPGHAPNPDGSPCVAWLIVREDFLKWVDRRARQDARRKAHCGGVQTGCLFGGNA